MAPRRLRLFVYPIGVPFIYLVAVYSNATIFRGIRRLDEQIKEMRRRMELRALQVEDDDDSNSEEEWDGRTEEQTEEMQKALQIQAWRHQDPPR